MFNLPRPNIVNVDSLAKVIRESQSIILTTHKQCDGDGLGAMLGLFHGLKKFGKDVRVFTVDEVPRKYHFLEPEKYLDVHEEPHNPIEDTDLALIFDTNDRRLVEPLFTELEEKCKRVLFVDHHPVLNQGPEPTAGSFINTNAASTGEIAFFILKELGIRLDHRIAQSLYTSLAFDTQIFRYVKGSAISHLIACELLEYVRQPEDIHRSLFATYTRDKISYLGKVLSEVEYMAENRVAVVHLSQKDLQDHKLDMDDSRDVIDMIMNVQSLQCAALFREESPNKYKLSLRSKGRIEVLSIAEDFNGGGHMYAAGAEVSGQYEELRDKVVEQLLQRLDSSPSTGT